MFAKLLKYEWRSNAAIFGILSLCALGVAILGGLILRLCITYNEQMPLMSAAGMVGGVFLTFLSLFAYAAAIWILLLVRFYKNKFTDEGYLTFTLPVNAHQIFLSSALNMLIWTLISLGVLGVAAVIYLLLSGLEEAASGVVLLWTQLQEAFLEEYLNSGTVIVYGLEWIVSLLYSIVLVLTCLTVGAAIAKKHKVLVAFGIYYGVSAVFSTVEAVFTLAYSLYHMNTVLESGLWYDLVPTVITTVIRLGILIAGYFLSTYLMKRKLNLN